MIVAHAHSTDHTRQIATARGVMVVDGGMPGPGRNRGAAKASAETILFLDADVLMPSTKFLEESLAEMDKKRLDVATCKVKPLSRKPIDRAMHEAYNAYVIATENVRPHAPGFCIFVRRNVHVAIQGFDEQVVFAEDHDYVQRAMKQGYHFAILRSLPIAVSVRRLEKDGRLAIALKYVFAEFMMIAKGPLKTMPFMYEMGGSDKDKDKDKDTQT